MKQQLFTIAFLAIILASNSQPCTPQPLLLKTPTLVSGPALNVGAIYKYTNVDVGINCYVKIVAAHNGTLSIFDDDATAYANSFQPNSTTTSTSTDPGYIKLIFDFRYASDSSNYYFKCLSIGIIDNDGNGTYAEKISTQNINSYSYAPSTQQTFSTDSFFNIFGTTTSFNGIDTTATAAMAEVTYRNVTTVTLKLGTYLTANNVTRQHSLYFKHFGSMNVINLPVKLINFDGKENDNKMIFNWSTASETYNDHFEIERSADGYNYLSIGTLKGAGNSNVKRNYSFTDFKPGNGKNYYRLKQIDFNGEVNFPSKTIVLSTKGDNNRSVSIYPNPTLGELNLTLDNYNNIDLTIEVQNLIGQIISSKNIHVKGQSQSEILDLSAIEKGIYYVVITTQDEKHIEKVVLK